MTQKHTRIYLLTEQMTAVRTKQYHEQEKNTRSLCQVLYACLYARSHDTNRHALFTGIVL